MYPHLHIGVGLQWACSDRHGYHRERLRLHLSERLVWRGLQLLPHVDQCSRRLRCVCGGRVRRVPKLPTKLHHHSRLFEPRDVRHRSNAQCAGLQLHVSEFLEWRRLHLVSFTVLLRQRLWSLQHTSLRWHVPELLSIVHCSVGLFQPCNGGQRAARELLLYMCQPVVWDGVSNVPDGLRGDRQLRSVFDRLWRVSNLRAALHRCKLRLPCRLGQWEPTHWVYVCVHGQVVGA